MNLRLLPYTVSSPFPAPPVLVHHLPAPLPLVPIDPMKAILYSHLVQRWPNFPPRELALTLSTVVSQVNASVLQQRLLEMGNLHRQAGDEIEEDAAEHFARIRDSPHFKGDMES